MNVSDILKLTVFFIPFLLISSCKKDEIAENKTPLFTKSPVLSSISEESGHGQGFRFYYDSESKLERFERTFDEDYHVSVETICDKDGYVRTLVTNNGKLSGGQLIYIVDSFPVLYDGDLVKEFSFLNQYESIEKFTFDYDDQGKIICVKRFKQFSNTSSQTNPIQLSQIEFSYVGDNINRIDDKLVNGNSTIWHDYMLYTYSNQTNPFSLIENKYYPFLCGFSVLPQCENLPSTLAYYSVTSNSMGGNSTVYEYAYDFREDGYPKRQQFKNDYYGYSFTYD